MAIIQINRCHNINIINYSVVEIYYFYSFLKNNIKFGNSNSTKKIINLFLD